MNFRILQTGKIDDKEKTMQNNKKNRNIPECRRAWQNCENNSSTADDDIVCHEMAMKNWQNRKQCRTLEESYVVMEANSVVLLKILWIVMNSVQAIAHQAPMFDAIFVQLSHFRY